MSTALMKCGHSANATVSNVVDGKDVTYPVCVICFGITHDAVIVVKEEEMPSLEGRQAKCSYDNDRTSAGRNHKDSRVQSDTRLAFFAHKPDQEYDDYYCGCFGWD